MGDASLSVLASSQVVAEGGNNFLVPNGTFFFVLAIFLIVLAVIGTFVVPPVMKVLRERDAMVAKTAADNRKAAEQFEAAQADYEEAMTEARCRRRRYATTPAPRAVRSWRTRGPRPSKRCCRRCSWPPGS